MRMRFSIIALILLATFTCRAQPLADRMPASTIFYMGWTGSDSLGPGYDDSHFKAVLDASSCHQLINEFLPAVAQKIAESDPQAAQVMPMIAAVVQPMWKYPTALYFGGLEMGQGQPMPKLALLIDAEGQADAVMQGLAGPLALATQSGAPITSKVENGVVVISVGPIPAELTATLDHPGTGSLMQDDAFKTTMAQVTPHPVAAGYISFTKLWAAVDQTIAALAPQVAGGWNMAKGSLALDGVKSVAFASGFDGKDWGTSMVLWAPAPRTGLAAQMQTPPLSDDIFKLVPKSSVYMTVLQADLGKLVQTLRMLAMLKPDVAEQVNQGVQQVNAMLGFDIQKDFFEAFGSEWAVYVDPEVGGNGIVGMTIVNRPADAAKLEQSLTKLEQLANNLIAQNMHDPKVHLGFETQSIGGTTLHYLGIPIITPTWAIRDGNLYMGAFPQPVAAGAAFGNAKGPSIIDNEKYQAIRKHLGPTAVTACTFVDVPALAPENYGAWTAISRLVGFGDILGVKSPLMVMAPLKTLMENLGPSGDVTWSDDFGFHFRGVDSFPGSASLAADPMGGVGAAAMMTSVMLPSLSRARRVADRTKSAANLRMIGEMCILYANENKQKYPDNLGQLVTNEDIVAGAFVCPMGHGTPPPARGSPQDMAAWVNEHSDYVYLAAGKTASELTSEKVVAHEKMEIAEREHGMNILFGDGHVEWKTLPEAQRLLKGNPQ
jgi:prepilin-type processing-associated H-X9-DG protein